MTADQRILVIEDDPQTARDILAILGKAGLSADHAATLSDGEQLAAGQPYNVILLDRMLPDGEGLEAIARLRGHGVDAMILVLSALGRAANRIEGLDLGADDYLAKPYEPDELIARVRALLRRWTTGQTDNDLLVLGPLQIRLKARTVHIGQAHVALSPREFELLVFFARNHGNTVTRMQLLENVWNLHFDPQTNVVDVHVSRLRRKLEDASDYPLLHTERGAGYVLNVSRGAA
ncbi:MAG: response regulator transcription factor [Pseudomonadota bacterium]